MDKLTTTLIEYLKEGYTVNNPKLENVLCEIVICEVENIISHIEVESAINTAQDEQTRRNCLLFRDALTYYIVNYERNN